MTINMDRHETVFSSRSINAIVYGTSVPRYLFQRINDIVSSGPVIGVMTAKVNSEEVG